MILLLDNYDSFTHNLYQYLAQLTEEEIRVVRNDRITVDEVVRLKPSRIVISPGPGRPENAGISVELVRRFAGDVPILGVCLGHQAIGEAFGGRTIGAARIVHGKTDKVTVDGRGLFRSINSPSEFVRYHSLAIDPETLPEELEITARSEDGEIMGVRHRELPVEGVQFHPESIGSEDGMKLLSNFLNYRREPFEPRVYLEKVIAGDSLTQKEAEEFMEELTDGNLSDAQIAAFLTAFNAKGIAPEEVAGCARVLQRKRVELSLDRPVLDTCGTGGDGLGTFNISSLTALVAAAAGATVAKHGNRAVSSRSGSADFYRALGIGIEISPERAVDSIRRTGFAFLYAPLYHGAMRFAGPARRQMGIKTIMNLLGPLVNPAGAQYQLIGVFSEKYLEVVARAAVLLGIGRGMVVHGLDGQDEISVCAPTRVISFTAGGDDDAGGNSTAGGGDNAGSSSTAGGADDAGGTDNAGSGGAGAGADNTGSGSTAAGADPIATARFEEFVIQPENYGLRSHPPEALVGGDAEENARVARRLLDGENGIGPEGIVDPVLAALHDAVVLNTAAALMLYGTVQTIQDGVELAMRTLEEGRAARTLEKVVEATN